MAAPDDAVSFDGVHCTMVIRRPRPGAVSLTITGNDTGELGDAPFRELEKDLAAPGTLELFVDARDTMGASIDVSGAWASWLAEHRARFEHVSMLTGSRFVRLTADFVKRFSELGERMRVYTEPKAFEQALAGRG